MTSKILIVDSDVALVDNLKTNLIKEQHQVITTGNGVVALELFRSEKPDLVILDIVLPNANGLDVCRILRKETSVPIMIISESTDSSYKIRALELGADDFVTKPFNIREFLARIRALLRRDRFDKSRFFPTNENLITITTNNFEIDLARHQLLKNGSEIISLRPKEFALLAYLMQKKGFVITREQIIKEIWKENYEGTTRTIDVHLRSLRKKIEDDPDNPKHLLTIHGIGYKFQ